MSNSDKFYESLDHFTHFNQFHENSRYSRIPSDWAVVITDVINSTSAIESGLYKQVNAVGVASIVAITNCIAPLKIPYIFGGDGATACIPKSQIQKIKPALVAAKQMANQEFNLDLRIGIISIDELERNNVKIKVAKFQPHKFYQQAMFSGDGISFAEKLIKNNSENKYLISQETFSGNEIFNGFECRWNEVNSPQEETICLLVQAKSPVSEEQSKIYDEVLQIIIKVYGHDNEHHPLKEDNLKLTGLTCLLKIETGIRCAFKSYFKQFCYLLKLKILKVIGTYLFDKGKKTKLVDWGVYKENLIINTDYRKFDEVLRMVISGTRLQRKKLREELSTLKQSNKIVYGIHSSKTALLTCIVTDYNKNHVHFLDGSNGGYAIAAKEMKSQLETCDFTD